MNSIEQEIANSIQAMETGESRYIEGKRIVTQSEIDLAEMEARQALEAQQTAPEMMTEGQAIIPQLEGEPQPIPGTKQGPQAFAGVEDQLNIDAIAGPVDNMGVGEFLEKTGQVFSGALGGAATATLGLPGDVVGIVEGIVQAAKAPEGEGLDAFLQGMGRVSEMYGSAATTKMLYDFVDRLDITDEAKEQIKAGSALLGEWAEIPGVAVAAKTFINGLQKLSPPMAQAISEPAQAVPQVQQIMAAGQEFSRAELPQRPAAPEPAAPEIDELGFVLKSLEVAKNLQQKTGTAQQFIKRLIQNGVSEDEIQAIGLRERFADPNERITRDQFEQEIRDRRIELEEVIKDTNSSDSGDVADLTFGEGEIDMDSTNWQGRAEDYMMDAKDGEDYAVSVIMDRISETFPDSYPPEEIARIRQALLDKEFDSLDAIDQRNIEDASYDVAEAEYLENPYRTYRSRETDNYMIYGNDDVGYQVLRNGTDLVNGQEVYSLGEAEIQARADAYDQGLLVDEGEFGAARFEEYMLPGGDEYQEILIKDPSTPGGTSPDHWSEGDVIGHALVKRRTDSEGRTIVFAEELQSDWAQSARANLSRTTEREQKRIEANQTMIEKIASSSRYLTEDEILSNKKPFLTDIEEARSNIARANERFAEEQGKLNKTRFVKDTQQWLRPTLKRLIAKAIEDGADAVAVPPYQVVHERWNDDYGDFYRKTVPNTLLKVAKQLDPSVRITKSDLTESAFPSLREEAASRGLTPSTKGMDQVTTIQITDAMRKAYKEKGQSLFVGAPTAIIGGKMAADAMTREQEND